MCVYIYIYIYVYTYIYIYIYIGVSRPGDARGGGPRPGRARRYHQ